MGGVCGDVPVDLLLGDVGGEIDTAAGVNSVLSLGGQDGFNIIGCGCEGNGCGRAAKGGADADGS